MSKFNNDLLLKSEVKFSEFPKIWSLGSPEIERLFIGNVEVTEKLDGSQFAFGFIDGVLRMRSKGAEICKFNIDKPFVPVVKTVLGLGKELKQFQNYVFYGETLFKPKHNTLSYNKVPLGNIALFGVKLPNGKFVDCWESINTYSERFYIGIVPLLYYGFVRKDGFMLKDGFSKLLETESCLGGEKIEGMIIKNYDESSTNLYSPQCFGKVVQKNG